MSSPWALVALSIAALALAPLLAQALQRRPALAVGLDSFVVVSVGAVVVLHVVPHSAQVVGARAVLAAVAGLLLPIALHRVDHALGGGEHATARTFRNVMVYALLAAGLFVHAVFDGAALVAHSDSLTLGVLAHRLPAGIALWVVLRPRIGLARTVSLLALYGGGTVVGALAGSTLEESTGVAPLALLQAFVAGSILHVVAESPPLASLKTSAGRLAGMVGVVLAVLALTAVAHEEAGAPALLDAVLSLALIMAPALFASFLLVGVLSALHPGGAPRLGTRGATLPDALAGMLAGLPHPLCACAVGPLYDDMIARGAPPAAARAFLVAAPALGVPAALLTARLLGWPFLLARIAAAAVVALAAGLAAARRPAAPLASIVAAEPLPPLSERLRHGLRHAIVDAVDHVGPWLVLGVLAAAALSTSTPSTLLDAIPTTAHPLLAALLGLPLYLCAAGITPVAAVLLALGLSPGGALAFLLVGPATSMATLRHLSARAGSRAALAHGAAVLVGALALGLMLDVTLGQERSAPAAWRLAPAEVGALEGVALLLLLGLLVASLWRQGVRGFVVQVMSPQHRHVADHAHGPGCAHDHGPPLAPPVPLAGFARRHAGAAKTHGSNATEPSPDAPRVRLSFDPRARPSSEDRLR